MGIVESLFGFKKKKGKELNSYEKVFDTINILEEHLESLRALIEQYKNYSPEEKAKMKSQVDGYVQTINREKSLLIKLLILNSSKLIHQMPKLYSEEFQKKQLSLYSPNLHDKIYQQQINSIILDLKESIKTSNKSQLVNSELKKVA